MEPELNITVPLSQMTSAHDDCTCQADTVVDKLGPLQVRASSMDAVSISILPDHYNFEAPGLYFCPKCVLLSVDSSHVRADWSA